MMDTLDPAPTVYEIEMLIKNDEAILEKWKGNPGYARNLMIGLFALHALLMLMKEGGISDKSQEEVR